MLHCSANGVSGTRCQLTVVQQGSGVFQSYPGLCGMCLTGRNRAVDGREHAA